MVSAFHFFGGGILRVQKHGFCLCFQWDGGFSTFSKNLRSKATVTFRVFRDCVIRVGVMVIWRQVAGGSLTYWMLVAGWGARPVAGYGFAGRV